MKRTVVGIAITALVFVAGAAWYGLGLQTPTPEVRLPETGPNMPQWAEHYGIELDDALERRAMQIFVTPEMMVVLGPDPWSGPRPVLARVDLDPSLLTASLDGDDERLHLFVHEVLGPLAETVEDPLECEFLEDEAADVECLRDAELQATPWLLYVDADLPWGFVWSILRPNPLGSGLTSLVTRDVDGLRLFSLGWNGMIAGGMPSRDWVVPKGYRATPWLRIASATADELELVAWYPGEDLDWIVEIDGKCRHARDQLEWLVAKTAELEPTPEHVVLTLDYMASLEQAASLRERVGYRHGDMEIGLAPFTYDSGQCASFEAIGDALTRGVHERYRTDQ